jgi:transcriptional regulator with XRE-family HTH domain
MSKLNWAAGVAALAFTGAFAAYGFVGPAVGPADATANPAEKEGTDLRAAILLRRARRNAVLSQAEVAERAGLPLSTVSAYEYGGRQPTLPMLSRLLEAIGAELILATRPAPQRLSALSGPVGLRVRRYRQLIVETASGYDMANVRVLGADPLEFLVDLKAGATLTGLLNLQADVEELVGVPVKFLTDGELSGGRRARAERDSIAL